MSDPSLALLVEALDPARGGGAEAAARSVARALAREGVAVALVGPADRLGDPEPGVRLLGVDVRASSRAERARRLADSLAAAARRALPGCVVVGLGKMLGADVHWSHGGVHAAGRDASVRAGRPRLLATLVRAGRRLRPVESVFDAVEAANARAALAGEQRCVALSERVRRDLAAHHGLDAARVPVIRNGVDLERYTLSTGQRADARRALRERAGAGPGDRIALFVGHAFALKGLDRAIGSLAFSPGTRLVVIGRGRRGPYQRLARARGVASRVTFAGEVAGLASLLGGVDVLVHPSRYDPCSLVVLEALAAGVPVIASPEDGSAELVTADAGFVLAAPEDPAELGARLEELADPALRARLGEGARACARPVSAAARELMAVAMR